MIRAIQAFLIISVMLCTKLGAQHNYDYNWLVGYELFNPDLFTIPRFNFDQQKFTIRLDTVAISASDQSLTLSDRRGRLIAYSNGCELRDSLDRLIPGSDPLLPGRFDWDYCEPLGLGMPFALSMFFLPFEIDLDTTLYYIFQDRNDFSPRGLITNWRYHTLLQTPDTLLLIEKDQFVDSLEIYNSFVNATRHPNREDWWVLSLLDTSQIQIIHLSATGIENIKYSSYPGVKISLVGQSSGQIDISSKGDKLAFFRQGNEFFYANFNRATGEITNWIRDTLHIYNADVFKHGTQFSPSGRYLYISVDSFVYQLDTEGPNFPHNAIVVAQTMKDVPSPFSGRKDNFSFMQMGPDCKIYIMTSSNTSFYHVIHAPDEAGVACDVDIRAIDLGTLNAGTIPLFPNYRLGTPDENWCDSLVSSTSPPIFSPPKEDAWRIWPQPARTYLSIDHPSLMPEVQALRLYHMNGTLVTEESIRTSGPLRWWLPSLQQGLYLLEINLNGRPSVWKKVVMQ